MDKKKQLEALDNTIDKLDEMEMNWRIKRAQELVAEQIRAEYRISGKSTTWNDSTLDAAYREMAQTAQRERETSLNKAFRDMAKVK